MRKFLSLFTHNWGIKLIALGLAIVVFYSVRGFTGGSSQKTQSSSSDMTKGPSNANAAR